MDYEEFRNEVAKRVKAKLGNEPWFRGVCCDDLRDYFKYSDTTDADIEEAVEYAECETLMWDAPNMGF